MLKTYTKETTEPDTTYVKLNDVFELIHKVSDTVSGTSFENRELQRKVLRRLRYLLTQEE